MAGRWTITGTNTGTFDLFGLPPTGRPVTMTGQEIFRAENGKLAEVWHQEDVPGMLRQLGLEPPRPSCGSPPSAAHAATGENTMAVRLHRAQNDRFSTGPSGIQIY